MCDRNGTWTIQALCALAALVGCRTRLDEPAAAPGDAAPLDAAVSQGCVSYHLVENADFASMSWLDDQSWVRDGLSERATAPIARGPCDVGGQVIYEGFIFSGCCGFVDWGASIWRAVNPAACSAHFTPAAPQITWSAFFDNAFAYNTAAGSQSLCDDSSLPALTTSCDAATLDAPCQRDCQCQKSEPRALCVPTSLQGGVCALPCAEDVDCYGAGERTYCNLTQTPSGICTRPPDHCACGPSGGCPFGQACADCVCHVIDSGPLPTARCQCDSECGPNEICGDGHCVRPCSSDPDCGDPACFKCSYSTCVTRPASSCESPDLL